MYKLFYSENGSTHIAPIVMATAITVIGAVSMELNEGSQLINKAQDAAILYQEAQNQEEATLKSYEELIDQYMPN